MADYKNFLKELAKEVLDEEGAEKLEQIGRTAAEKGKEALNYANAVKNAVAEQVKEQKKAAKSSSDILSVINCPGCGAALEVENGIDTFYCRYCGTKVILQNQSKAAIKAKETIKKLEHREAMADKKREELELKEKFKAARKEEQRKTGKKLLIGTLVFLALFYGFIAFYVIKGKKAVEAENASLEAIVQQIEVDISNGEYEAALRKANTLYFTENSRQDKRKWNNVRRSYEKQIEELIDREAEQAVALVEEAAPVEIVEDTIEQIAEEPVLHVEDSSTVQEPAAIKDESSKNVIDYHSSGDKEKAKSGDTGVYSYKSRGGEYSIYYIIDFDEGYVYRFSTSESVGERVPITKGSLNDLLILTYHDGGDTWYEALNFKFASKPDHLIHQDAYGTSTDFYPSDLSEALILKKRVSFKDY